MAGIAHSRAIAIAVSAASLRVVARDFRCWLTLMHYPAGARSRRSGTETTLGGEALPVQLHGQQAGLGPRLVLVEVVR